MGFDPIASSHFHVFEYMEEDGQCMGVNIYSSKTVAWIFIGLFSSSVISLLSKLSSYYMHTDEMEEAPNKRNTLASLMDDVYLEILRRLPARSLFCYKCVYCS